MKQPNQPMALIYDGICGDAQPCTLDCEPHVLSLVIQPNAFMEMISKNTEIPYQSEYIIAYSELSLQKTNQYNFYHQNRQILIEIVNPDVHQCLKQHFELHNSKLEREWKQHNITPVLGIAALLGGAMLFVFFNLYRFVPLTMEQQMGEILFSSMTEEYEQCTNPQLQQALEEMVQKDLLPSDQYPIHIVVLDSEERNAFAILGGNIAVFRGLIEQSEHPDEVAGIIAHEMGHVEEKHSLRNVINVLGFQFALQMVLGNTEGLQMLTGVGSMGGQLLLLQNSRNFEREADQQAIQRLNHSQTSTVPLANFMTRLGEHPELEATLEFLSSHPDSLERSQVLQQANQYDPTAVPAEWNELKHYCE